MFNKFKEKLSDISTNGLPVVITSNMIERLIKIKSDEQDVKVEITNGHLVLQGKTEVKKMVFKKDVSFTVILKPIQFEKRTIQFKLVDMKPVDMNFINSKIFNKAPFMEYTNRLIKIDFNQWDNVKKIPVGNIKSYELSEGVIKLKLSL